MRMSAEAAEQGTARLQRLQKVKCGNRSSRSMRFLAIARDHECRPSVSLDDTRCRNPNDPAMPAVAINHHAERVPQNCILAYALLDRIDNAPLFLLALAVELVEALGNLLRLCCFLGAEQIDDVARNVHPSRSV